jgi:steroid 5-alpha reductase family enzyme
VGIRNIGKQEDYRYIRMRKSWNNSKVAFFFRIYMFQGFIIFLVGFPSFFINTYSNIESSLFLTDWLGIIIWIIGFQFETVADYQLFRFKKDPENQGKIMVGGLWKYSQHPNYFGEVTQWWGIYLIALGVNFGFITIFGPIIITFMIMKVSGIRLLNYRYRNDKVYAVYKKKTPNFIPWFPKKGSN